MSSGSEISGRQRIIKGNFLKCNKLSMVMYNNQDHDLTWISRILSGFKIQKHWANVINLLYIVRIQDPKAFNLRHQTYTPSPMEQYKQAITSWWVHSFIKAAWLPSQRPLENVSECIRIIITKYNNIQKDSFQRNSSLPQPMVVDSYWVKSYSEKIMR